MLLLTGATGLVGSHLLRLLTAQGTPVRVLVRDPRRLGAERVRVQIALGDLAEPDSFRHALRGVDTVVHLAATVRDQPQGTIEDLNGAATWRMVRAAERAGVEHFVLYSAIGAAAWHPARFFRSKALAERVVRESGLRHTILAPSIVYAPGDRWLTVLHALSLLPAMPMPGRGRAVFEPIWAEDAATATLAALRDRREGRIELAGPERITHREFVALALRSFGRRRPIVPIPEPVVRRALRLAGALGGAAFATWEEAELLEYPLVGRDGAAGARSLGVDPRRAADVLGATLLTAPSGPDSR
jgi:NADH dehydrogenase